jgi:glycosyltransferase involved in cell wall biosynthesis
MTARVSVIIPVYNGAAYLAEAIESVLAQDHPAFEIIVADDGSVDESLAVARRYPVTALALAHGGVSAARNAAVAASTGEWLGFLDADDIWLPRRISAQLAAAEDNPEAGLVLCERTHKFELVPDWFIWPVTETESKTCFEPSAWLVRRSTFEAVGGFIVGRALGEDMNWLIRAWSMGVRHAVARETLVRRRIHGNNASAVLPSVKEQMLALLRESLAVKRAMREDEAAAARAPSLRARGSTQ